MKRIILCILLVLCVWSGKVRCEELTWGTHTAYGPMPVLFIHGINANSLTWDIATKELEMYFGYKWKRYDEGWITDPPNHYPVTYDDTDDDAPQNQVVKHYLEAFDYGGKDSSGGFRYHIGSHTPKLKSEIEKILKAYYGEDNWQNAKLNIIAHSMGGLIARHYIQKADGAKRVKRLITIGTPHLGSGWAILPRIIGFPTNLPILGAPYKILLLKPVGAIFKIFTNVGNYIVYADSDALVDLTPQSNFLNELNNNADIEIEDVEFIALVGIKDKRGDGIVSIKSQKAEGVLSPDYIIELDGISHGDEPKQVKAILKSLDGIPDKGTKTYDTPLVKVWLGTYTESATSTITSEYIGSRDNFYVYGKVYDYLPGSCTVTIELDNEGNFAKDEHGNQIKDMLINPINMLTEAEEDPKTRKKLNSKFNFKLDLSDVSDGRHYLRITIKNPAELVGTATTEDGDTWLPFTIRECMVEVIAAMSFGTGTPLVPVPGGLQAASSIFFWESMTDNVNIWERWVNSNLRVDSDNIIRYNIATSTLGTTSFDDRNLRHRIYLESRIYPAEGIAPKASVVNKKEMQAITYTYASHPFKLIPFTKSDGTTVYRPDVDENGTITYPEDIVVFTNNEVIFTPKKSALPNLNFRPIIPGNPLYTYPLHIIIPADYEGISSDKFDVYINQIGALHALSTIQKAYDYAVPLSAAAEFKPVVNIAWCQAADLTYDGITCFGSNTKGIYRIWINGKRGDELNEDKLIQAYANALLTHYKQWYYKKLNDPDKQHYEAGYDDYKLPIMAISYDMSPDAAFVAGFCMRFSAAVRGSSIVELPVTQPGITFDISQSTHQGTRSALAIAQSLYRIPINKIWQALETPIITLDHSGYTIIDLLNELDAQGYDTTAIREEFFSTAPAPFQPIKYVETEGYEEDYIEPDCGTAGTTFTFKIKYQDATNNPPLWVAVRVKNGEEEIPESPFEMEFVEGEISTGAIYETKVQLTKAGSYTYWIHIIDSVGIEVESTEYQFKVTPGKLYRLEISPTHLIVPINNEVEFEVKGYDEFGNKTLVISNRWSVIGNIGTLSTTLGSRTTFIAGNVTGTGTIICQSLDTNISALTPIKVILQGPVYIPGGEVSGRWTKGGSPYVITDDIYIPKGKTLRIDPGVEVKFHYYIAKWNDTFLDWLIPPQIIRRKLTVYGSLIAEGTEQEPIIFSPISDGGTTTPASGGTSTPCFGDWDKIIFGKGSHASLKHCIIKYAGYADWWYYSIITIQPAVLIKSEKVKLFNCIVTNEGGCARKSSKLQGIGILIEDVNGDNSNIISNCEIAGCWGGIVIKNCKNIQIDNNTIRDDGSHGIQIVNSSCIKILTNTITNVKNCALSQDLYSYDIEYRGNNTVDNEFDLIWLVGSCPERSEVILKKSDIPYGFNSLTIPKTSILRIEPGAKFVLTRLGHAGEDIRNVGWLHVYGTLIAEGTQEEEIVFDKGKFGNWNYIKFIGHNASQSSLRYCKIIGGGRRDSGSCIGESNVVTGSLWLINSTPKIEHCKILDSKWYDQPGLETVGGYWDCGIRLEDLPPEYILSNNTISNCTKGIATYNCPNPPIIATNTLTNNTYCFYQDPNSFPEYHNNIYENNEYPVILTGRASRTYQIGVSYLTIYTGCEITVPQAVWKKQELPYAIDKLLIVRPQSSLIIEPGVKVMGVGATLDVEGKLKADATKDNRIIFTSINDDGNHIPEPGDWSQILFREGSYGTLTHCTVKYAITGVKIDKANVSSILNSTFSDNKYFGLYLNNASPVISTCTFSYNLEHGIICDNASPVIRNGTISYNGSKDTHHGIICKNYSNPHILKNVISHNKGCGIGQDMNSFPIYGDNIFYGNKYDAIGITGGYMTINGTWTNRGEDISSVYLLFGGGITIGKTATLVIEPGVVIKPYSYLDSSNSPPYWHSGQIIIKGTLLAQGTKDRPIVFTSFFDDTYGGDTNSDGSSEPRRWRYIKFCYGSNGIMEHCIVKYAGAYGNYYEATQESDMNHLHGLGVRGNIWIDSASPIIQNCYISDSDNRGISLSGQHAAQPIIKNNIITNNPTGIYHRGDHKKYTTPPIAPIINDNYIYHNNCGISHGEKGTYTLDALNNWWGHPSGPEHKNNPNGKGDKIKGDNVIYEPWIGKDFIVSPAAGTIGSLVSIFGSIPQPSIRLGISFGKTGTIAFTTTNSYGSFSASFTVPIEKADEKEIFIIHPEVGKMSFGTFTIIPGKLHNLKIYPKNITIGCGGNYDFDAQGYDMWDNPIPNLEYFWQISPKLGSISPTAGYFTIFYAGTTPMTGSISVTSGSFTTFTTITLTANPPQYPMTGTIVFIQGPEDDSKIIIMNADGSNKQQVNTQDKNVHYYPRLSKDAKFLAYFGGNDTNRVSLYSHNLLSSNETLLEENMNIRACNWNNNGDKIYYGELYYISPDGKIKEKIEMKGNSDWEKKTPKHPYVNLHENQLVGIVWNTGVRIYNLSGTKATFIKELVVVLPPYTTEAIFSPDGRRIAYIDNSDGKGNNLWLMTLDGKMKRRITHGTSTNGVDGYPFAFSPDGTRLIYYRDGDLWVINLDGTGERNITNTPDIIERHVDWVGGELYIGKVAYIEITPGSITIGCGGNYDFEAQGYDKYGNKLANLEYHWQISTNLGIISPTTGYFTVFYATTTPTTGTLTVTVGTITGCATITISTSTQYPMFGTIVFLAGDVDNGEIFIMKADELGTPTKINIKHTIAPYSPKLSKDAKFLAYGADQYEWGGLLYVHNLLSGTETLLQEDVRWLCGWNWNVKGDRIYYHYFGGQGNGIYCKSPDGKNEREIKGAGGILPAVNPDENLLFVTEDYKIILYDLEETLNEIIASNERILAESLKTHNEIRFSPDGRRIAYIYRDDTGTNLWLMSIDGKMKRKITKNGSGCHFAFSPCGNQLIFNRAGDLWVINIDGTGERNITNSPDIDERHVDWVGELSPIFIKKMQKLAPIITEKSQFPEDLSGAFVYPNPTDGTKLIFAGLTENVRIQVFTITGERVFDIKVPYPNNPDIGKYQWNCQGSEGQRLASGIYIYLLTNDKGDKKIGKLGIIR